MIRVFGQLLPFPRIIAGRYGAHPCFALSLTGKVVFPVDSATLSAG
jgi:hypothetical protein